MKITKEYLREIIKEAIEEVGMPSGPMRGKIRKFAKTIPSSGFHEPQPPPDEGGWGSDLPSGKFRIKKLAKFTGVERSRGGAAHHTELAPKGYYVEHFTGLETYMTGPFSSEKEAREYIKEKIAKTRKDNYGQAAHLRGEPDED